MNIKLLMKLAAFCAGVLLFTGGACPSNDTTASSKVAQTEIYQSYSITQSDKDYDVTAYFRVGGKTGTTLVLTAPSKVTFNGQAMQEHLDTTSGTYYTARVPISTANGTFAFTDRNGKTYSNRIDLARVALSTAKLTVNRTSPVPIAISGTSANSPTFNLQMNNRLVFVGEEQGEMTEAYYDKTQNSIVLLPAAWKEVESGNVTVDLEVRHSISTQEGTALGGEIAFVYNAAPVQVAYVKGKGGTNKTAAKKTSAAAKK